MRTYKVKQGDPVTLTCEASPAKGDAIESYTWYETKDGTLRGIIAIGAFEGYAEVNAELVCDTETVGTRYYVCSVCTVGRRHDVFQCHPRDRL